jgi:hypothetical protein
MTYKIIAAEYTPGIKDENLIDSLETLRFKSDYADQLNLDIYDELVPIIVPSVGRGGGEIRRIGNFIIKFVLAEGEFQANKILRLMGEQTPDTSKLVIAKDLAIQILRKEEEEVEGLNVERDSSRLEHARILSQILMPIISGRKELLTALIMPYVRAKNLGEYLCSDLEKSETEYLLEELGRIAIKDLVIGTIDRLVQLKKNKVHAHPNYGNMMVLMELGERRADTSVVLIDSLLNQGLITQLAWGRGLDYSEKEPFVTDICTAIITGLKAYNSSLDLTDININGIVEGSISRALKELKEFEVSLSKPKISKMLEEIISNEHEKLLVLECINTIIHSMVNLCEKP